MEKTPLISKWTTLIRLRWKSITHRWILILIRNQLQISSTISNKVTTRQVEESFQWAVLKLKWWKTRTVHRNLIKGRPMVVFTAFQRCRWSTMIWSTSKVVRKPMASLITISKGKMFTDTPVRAKEQPFQKWSTLWLGIKIRVWRRFKCSGHRPKLAFQSFLRIDKMVKDRREMSIWGTWVLKSQNSTWWTPWISLC